MKDRENWFRFKDSEQVDTPALLIYPERVIQNIDRIKKMVPAQLMRPHVKTNKSADVTRLMMQRGINKFKCATIAEAEMLGMCKAPDALLAYQPTKTKLKRLIQLISAYPDTKYSCLVDNQATASMISELAWQNNITIPVYIDLNVGMNRTGIKPEKAFELFNNLLGFSSVKFMGFHAYDGHIRDKDIHDRTNHCEHDYKPVTELRNKIRDAGHPFPLLVAGGSPTFAIHSKNQHIECSPGTFIFWDKGYYDTIPEQDFLFGALVLTRVVSFPDETKICIDLGYKSISSENDLQSRVYFLNAPDLQPYSHSEEHMVIEVGPGHNYKIGDELFALPMHICPTVAMYNDAYVIEGGALKDKWKITSRGREISI